MLKLTDAIQAIRQRAGETQVRFADELGIAQNTLSQYETGKVVPSFAVLTELFRRAGTDEEKQTVLEALKQRSGSATELTEADVTEMGRIWHEYVRAGSPRLVVPRRQRALLTWFARIGSKVLKGELPLDDNIIEILQLWAERGRDRKGAPHFREIASYLRVQLAVDKQEVSLATGTRSRRRPENKG